jgi:hypothetical protein
MVNMIFDSIKQGHFDFRRGNTLASFAETFSTLMDINTKDSRTLRVPEDIVNGSQDLSHETNS